MDKKLTFGELEIGDKFIDFPVAGDNAGHGGFKGTSYIFTKFSSASAIKTFNGSLSMMPDSMEVIRIK